MKQRALAERAPFFSSAIDCSSHEMKEGVGSGFSTRNPFKTAKRPLR